MRLVCLFTISVFSLPVVRMSRVEASGAHPAHFELHPHKRKKIAASSHVSRKKQHEREGLRVQRAVRKYPEDVEQHLDIEHRRVSFPMEGTECTCPEMLNKGTLGAIVAALALLGFFSTSVLLVVAICVLRLVAKQRKPGKEVKAVYQNPPQRRPPAPLPRPEHTLLAVKPHIYEQIHPSSPQLPREGTYLTASELNPGPRTRRTRHYSSMKPLSPYAPNPEKDYAVSRRLQLYSNSPMVNKYANVEEPQSPAIMQGSPDNAMSPRGRDNHIYEELE